ncbi:hypothetical protein CEQ90_02405 [Lewinellaceae bacterium SD302]|nr:hypothetical protein CEQ90_02405 [Lewinellaceae bacterium SD302]
MKSHRVYFILLLFCASFLVFSTSSCAKKVGCDTLGSSRVKLKKDGMPRGKAKSQLFDKKTRRKMN